jgi:Tol biopolymer transport system component
MKGKLPMNTFRGRLLVFVVPLVVGAGALSPRADAAPAPVQLTTTGLAVSPVYSPNGQKIAFGSLSPDFRFMDVVVMNADGSGQTPLTTTGVYQTVNGLTWSPGGDAILFDGTTPEDGAADLFVVDADGQSAPVNLTNTPGVNESEAQWSANGRKIVFSIALQDIWVMNADGTGLTNLTNNEDVNVSIWRPAWSPNGRQIAFVFMDVSVSIAPHIDVMNADGSNVTEVTSDEAFQDDAPAWSPNGRSIAFFRHDFAGNNSVVVIDLADGNLTNVSASLPLVFGPGVWSPNGRQIAFVAGFPADIDAGLFPEDVYVVNADGTGLLNVTNSPAVREFGPVSWSRNGQTLAYFAAMSRGGPSDIYAISLLRAAAKRSRPAR